MELRFKISEGATPWLFEELTAFKQRVEDFVKMQLRPILHGASLTFEIAGAQGIQLMVKLSKRSDQGALDLWSEAERQAQDHDSELFGRQLHVAVEKIAWLLRKQVLTSKDLDEFEKIYPLSRALMEQFVRAARRGHRPAYAEGPGRWQSMLFSSSASEEEAHARELDVQFSIKSLAPGVARINLTRAVRDQLGCSRRMRLLWAYDPRDPVGEVLGAFMNQRARVQACVVGVSSVYSKKLQYLSLVGQPRLAA